jgi:hypothetical protein
MGEVITNLKARFGVETQGMDKGLSDLDKKVGNTVSGLKNMITPLALLGGAGGAFAALKGAIESVEGPGDRLEATMGGLKESLFEAGKALVSLDFRDFLANLKDGYDRGVAFTEMLDGLADRSAYNDYRINQMKRESAELQEILKNKTLELSERTAVIEKITALEEGIRDRRMELAREEFAMQKDLWEGRNDMETDMALKLYEQIDAMGPELKERLKKAFESSMAGAVGIKGAEYAFEIVTRGLYSYDKTLYQEVPKDVIKSYGEYFKLLQLGERDVLIKLFNTFKNIEETGYRAQEDYNTTVAQTTKLLAQEEKALNGVADAEAKKREELEKSTLAKLKGDAIKVEDPRKFQLYYNFDPLKQGLVGIKQQVKETTNEIGGIVNQSLGTALDGMANWLGEFAVGMETGQGLVRIVGSSFGDMLISLGRVAIATGIGLAAIQKAFETMNPAVALVAGGALIALGAAIKASVSKVGNSIGAGGSSGSSGAGGDYTYDTRGKGFGMQELKVTGEFVLKNNVLVAAIDEENKRRRATT